MVLYFSAVKLTRKKELLKNKVGIILEDDIRNTLFLIKRAIIKNFTIGVMAYKLLVIWITG